MNTVSAVNLCQKVSRFYRIYVQLKWFLCAYSVRKRCRGRVYTGNKAVIATEYLNIRFATSTGSDNIKYLY